eukprot:scaffold127802_cov18-Tisochrysis_lutea.AAC.1
MGVMHIQRRSLDLGCNGEDSSSCLYLAASTAYYIINRTKAMLLSSKALSVPTHSLLGLGGHSSEESLPRAAAKSIRHAERHSSKETPTRAAATPAQAGTAGPAEIAPAAEVGKAQ